MTATPPRHARRAFPLLALAAALACGGEDDRRVEPPILHDRIFDASTDSIEAFAYITREDRLDPGPTRLSQRFDRYTLYVRRLPDGTVVKELPLGDIISSRGDSTPRIIGMSERILWIQRDSVEGYRVPLLDAVPLTANSATDDASTAAMRTRVAQFIAAPFWERPGSARLFTAVSRGLLPSERDSPYASLALAQSGVLMRNDRSAWTVDAPASVLLMSIEADSTWSVSRVTTEGKQLWTTPLELRFERGFVVLDAATHVVFMDSQPHAERSGARDRVVWVNVATGEKRALEIATGEIAITARK